MLTDIFIDIFVIVFTFCVIVCTFLFETGLNLKFAWGRKEAETIASEALDAGKLDAKNDILENPYHPYTEMLMNAVPKVGRKWKEGIKLAEIETKEFKQKGCKFAARCPVAGKICTQYFPALISSANNGNGLCFKYTDYEPEKSC